MTFLTFFSKGLYLSNLFVYICSVNIRQIKMVKFNSVETIHNTQNYRHGITSKNDTSINKNKHRGQGR